MDSFDLLGVGRTGSAPEQYSFESLITNVSRRLFF